MTNQEKRRKFLLDCFTEDGWFYIVKKKAILVTDDSDLKIGAKVQFTYTDNDKQQKIRKGKIIMESRKYTLYILYVHIYLK